MAQLILCVKAADGRLVFYCGEGNKVHDTSQIPTAWVACGNSEIRVTSVSEFDVGGVAKWQKRPKGGGSTTSGQTTLQRDEDNFCP
ncbi:MAG: hypothetical protein DWQ08_06560 [Proteobacteria bacterium]|nr:MAG: hypothetical protein DWQ08_06560 [Pseudomonadota bacterium]